MRTFPSYNVTLLFHFLQGKTHIFEAPVEDLQLFLGELGLLLQLVHALGAMTHSGQLKVIFHAVCVRDSNSYPSPQNVRRDADTES